MRAMLRKKLEIAGKYSNKTDMASAQKFQTHFGVSFNEFRESNIYFSVHLLLLSENQGLKYFKDLSEIKHTEFLGFCIFPLLCAIV